MYSGKIAVPPGGGGIRRNDIIQHVKQKAGVILRRGCG
jgi:hypothetical protein